MNPLLTKEQVAARAGISVRTLDLHFQDGTGPRRTLVDNRAFVSAADCRVWLNSRARREAEHKTDQFAEWISPAQVKPRFGFGRDMTYRLIAAGEIEARKVGKRTVLSIESIRRYLAQQPAPKVRGRRLEQPDETATAA